MNAFIDQAVAFSANNIWLLAILAFASAASEAIVVVGVVVPGTAILLAVSALAGVGGHVSLLGVIIAAAIMGAIAGDGLSYWLGRHFGRDLVGMWPFSRHPEWLKGGEAFFARHGGKSVFIGRFVPGVKTVIPAVAGMSQMPVGRFLLANVTSAILWSLALVLSGLGIGRGLDRSGLADPRVVVLLIAFLIALGLAYWLLRFILLRGMPAFARARRDAMTWLTTRPGRPAALAWRLLANEGGAMVALAWIALSMAALLGFLAILGQVIFDDGFSQADAIISNFVESLRFEALDRLMIAVTMAGDGIVLAVLAAALLLWLLAFRQWFASAATAVAFGSTLLFVPAVKAILGRQRPNALYEGADAFSFPSGHATHAMVIFGIIAILLAHRRPLRSRFAIYLAAIGLALLIALSRIYLGAHWPSDVAGGFLFGSSVIAAFAFALRERILSIRPVRLALALLLAFGVTYGIHVERAYTLWTRNYTYAPQTAEITLFEWRDGGWASLPRARITLGGEPPQPFIAQYAGSLAPLMATLARDGWQSSEASLTQHVLSVLLPYGGLKKVPPATLLHDGRLPVAMLTKPSATGRRMVLRIWSTERLLNAGDGHASRIHLLDLGVEIYRPVMFGFGDLDEAPPTPADLDAVRLELGKRFEAVPPAVSPDREGPLLLRESQ
ncbi:bifunctional DedA family/phosphatase PAP2 family protein [Aurantimonas marina]|uniref:bifunctional DedA family/phosphatase PAP2 family protein n=1 Tax=Aurantimonas marina TaxID=2780508 RepID=UPI0019D312BA|nr:bifunctional DedA family/phosphatase PAP2 family protein [Aurantimonas marina]